MATQRTRSKVRSQPADPKSLERSVRQLLADRVSGNQVGIWLLLPEHLRLGTWDLLCQWAAQPPESLEPRLAWHLIHEAALCLRDLRHDRSLSQKGFELANGLPFVPTDQVIHDLLEARTVADSERLQIALGKLRRANHHFQGKLLALDPHRMQSFSRRQMRRRQSGAHTKPEKVGQCFFCVDADTHQPVCFTLGSSALEVTQITPHLLEMAAAILNPDSQATKPLALADKEHFSAELIDPVVQKRTFDLLVPMPSQPALRRRWEQLPAKRFKEHWPGYAIAKQSYRPRHSQSEGCFKLIQRTGAKEPYQFQGFFSTGDRPQLASLTGKYPKRWRAEEFFKFNESLGWERAGTLNLNVRYGQGTLALMAQAAIHQLRQRLGPPFDTWDASHFARELFGGLDGDIRVSGDTIVVTYYNAPNADKLRACYENLEEKLAAEGLSNRVPWLYNFKLDFRFK